MLFPFHIEAQGDRMVPMALLEARLHQYLTFSHFLSFIHGHWRDANRWQACFAFLG